MSLPFRHKALGYFKLNVTDMVQSTSFLTEIFGLDLVMEDERGQRFFRGSTGHQDIILSEAPKPGLVRSSWELESDDDLEAAFSYFENGCRNPQWVENEELTGLHLKKAFRIIDPVVRGTWEFFSGMTSIPSPRENSLTRFEGGKHFGLIVPDVAKLETYLTSELGFLVSDDFEGGGLSLLRAWPNPNHHSIAAIQSRSSNVRSHHFAFMVREIDDIGRLFNRAVQHNTQIQFGIGRHPTSGSIHLYVFGPDYFVWEYTLGMEQFPETGAREPRRMSADPKDFDLWGAVPDTQHNHQLPELVQEG